MALSEMRVLVHGKLTDYLDDMTTIVAAFCRQIGGPAMIYRRKSALAERLVFMKCSAAQLLPNCDHAVVQVCLTERLNELQQEVSCVKWYTATELLFVLLQTEFAVDYRFNNDRRECLVK